MTTVFKNVNRTCKKCKTTYHEYLFPYLNEDDETRDFSACLFCTHQVDEDQGLNRWTVPAGAVKAGQLNT